ncbi:glutathione peroxidase [Malassezia vespertilionis]|uniref:Glutathione peroxidase n=1 Tax=Malassezia vespertilionis TaxID=2020962 RepID=A0A2N1JBP1_9BASI|nr:glutathione peroxidase [Malassezia vespertilionis]PKI83971.1 hypothetical protein MVES_001940 [Malassezia vespertilionis]WFD06696.1 glutathione peroxidase [Malassezia vespertilionis]
MVTFYDLKSTLLSGAPFDFSQLKNKVVLVVNTASKCGFTPQLEGLETLYKTYSPKGLAILGFPCNQFAGQEPGDSDTINSFCQKNYGVSFPIMSKSDVNGPETNETFKYLKHERPGMFGTEMIKWNFTKFLVDKNGKVVERYSPTTKPEHIAKDIEKLLQQ